MIVATSPPRAPTKNTSVQPTTSSTTRTKPSVPEAKPSVMAPSIEIKPLTIIRTTSSNKPSVSVTVMALTGTADRSADC